MKFRDRLYVSTIADDACRLAAQHRLGLEIAEFCTAACMDDHFSEYGPMVVDKMRAARRFVFHGPFNELSPASIDPLALALTRQRYLQACRLAHDLGIDRVVIHSGYTPMVYHKSWMKDRSIAFWKALLPELPEGTVILLENVMEDGPELIRDILEGVSDRRLRACLDVGHANTVVSRTKPLDWIGPLAPYLSHVHIHNNMGDMDLHQNLDDGTIPMADLLQTLERSCTNLTYTIEAMHAEPSIRFLQRIGLLEQEAQP